MKKHILLTIVMLLAGCAELLEETHLKPVDSPSWRAEKPPSSYYYLTHDCNQDDSVSLLVEKELERDARLFLIFFILPIHSAESSDRLYSGIRVTRKNIAPNQSCAVTDASLTMDDQIFTPIEVEKKDPPKGSICAYTWKPEIQDKGSFSISFIGDKDCAIPPIKFEYEKSTVYDFLTIEG